MGKFLTIVSVVFCGMVNVCFARVYPVNQISTPECYYSHRSQHDVTCQRALPRIQSGEYLSYVNNFDYRTAYSVLWWATYEDWRDPRAGSHLGVDIVSARGTPVFSIWEGKIIHAWPSGGWWNAITIQYPYLDWFIYASYAHLESILVSVGDTVTTSSQIWTIGDTWNATAPHLHFQLERDTVGSHPYWYSTCSGIWWLGIFDIVNGGFCRTEMQQFTFDPIVFLESQWADVSTFEINWQTYYNYLDAADVLSQQEIERYQLSQFLGVYDIELVSPSKKFVFSDTQSSTLFFNKVTQATAVLLPEPLRLLVEDKDVVDVFPETLSYIQDQQSILLLPKQSWTTMLHVYFGKELVRSIQLTFWDVSIPVATNITTTCIPSRRQQKFDSLCLIKARDDDGQNIITSDRNGIVQLPDNLYIPQSKQDLIRIRKWAQPSFSSQKSLLTAEDFLLAWQTFVFVRWSDILDINVLY